MSSAALQGSVLVTLTVVARIGKRRGGGRKSREGRRRNRQRKEKDGHTGWCSADGGRVRLLLSFVSYRVVFLYQGRQRDEGKRNDCVVLAYRTPLAVRTLWYYLFLGAFGGVFWRPSTSMCAYVCTCVFIFCPCRARQTLAPRSGATPAWLISRA